MEEHQKTNFKITWTEEDLKQLAQALTFAYKSQNTYKEPLDLKDRVTGWQFVLEGDFTIGQVMFGIKKFMKASPNMPVPADVYQILDPAKPEITATEYLHAKKQWELNGYPMFCNHRDIVKAYEAQTQEKQGAFRIESEEVQALVNNSVKRIK